MTNTNNSVAALSGGLTGLVLSLAGIAVAEPALAPAAAVEAVQAISPMYNKVVSGLPDPVHVLDTSGLPHVIYYETVNTPLANKLEFALRYTYLDSTIVRSFRIPASGFFTTTCVLQSGVPCTPRLTAPQIVMDSQKRAHIVAQGTDSYDYINNTSTAQIINVTCPPAAACSSPVQVTIFQGQCATALPRGGKCPPPPPRAQLAIANDQLYLNYSDSMNYAVELMTLHWVNATRPAAGGSWGQVFNYTSTVTDTLPLEGPAYLDVPEY